MHLVDWLVVAALCLLSLGVGLFFAGRASRKGADAYFTGDRNLPWWAIGLSNTATYSSGQGGFIMLVLVFGIAGNWLWWASWIVWMPLVGIIWARLWRRMQIVTTAELITLRYGGKPAKVARKIYAAVCCFGFCVLIIGYITGFFVKTLAPLVPISETQTLLIFGAITVVYTMFGGLVGVVYTDVMQFFIMMTGAFTFMLMAIPQHGGWHHIIDTVQHARPETLHQFPPVPGVDLLTIGILVIQGLFFAGSPTAGEGMTAQRFMSARNERHAIGGQLFNAFLALSLRTIPLIGLGIVSLSLFWTTDLAAKSGRPMPEGFTMLADPAHAWGELINRCVLPVGFVGVLVAAEVAAYMSALSSLINWGSSFLVNDVLTPLYSAAPVVKSATDAPLSEKARKREILISRISTVVLFALAAGVAMLFVKGMVSWFLFINSAMVIFLLPLAWFRFFWWRFNVWGELAAIILGLPASIVIWFVLDYQNRPMWQGVGLLFLSSFIVLITVTLLTPPESPETLRRFYARCRPPGFWTPVRRQMNIAVPGEPSFARQIMDSVIGTLACLGLVVATNGVFVGDWKTVGVGVATLIVFGVALLVRIWNTGRESSVESEPDAPQPELPVSAQLQSIPLQ